MSEKSLRTDDFDDVINKYSNMVYRIAFANCKIKADAEDVFQEVFLLYYKKRITFKNEQHRRNWLINVTLKYCKKIYSSSWYNKTDLSDDVPLLEIFNENEYIVYSAVQTLPFKYRNVIYLYYYEGFSTDEISEITGTKPSGVRSQLKRGREKLETLLKGEIIFE